MDTGREQVRAWVESMDAQGYTSDEIRDQLALAGWSQADIAGLLGQPVAPPVVPPPVVPPPVEGGPTGGPPGAGYAQAPAPEVAAVPPNGMATAALILGIASCFFGPLVAIVGIILGIIGGKRGGPQRGQAVGGLIISLVVLAGWLFFGAIFLIAAYFGAKSSEGPSDGITTQQEQLAPESDEVQPEGIETGPGGDRGDDKVVCLARVKALAQGMQMYAADCDDTLPDAAAWPRGLEAYVQADEYLCPADDRVDPQDPGGRPTSFTMYDPMGGLILSSLSEPAQAYLLFDGTEVSGEEAAAAFRHEGGLNLAYVDGHVRWVGEEKFRNPG